MWVIKKEFSVTIFFCLSCNKPLFFASSHRPDLSCSSPHITSCATPHFRSCAFPRRLSLHPHNHPPTVPIPPCRLFLNKPHRHQETLSSLESYQMENGMCLNGPRKNWVPGKRGLAPLPSPLWMTGTLVLSSYPRLSL